MPGATCTQGIAQSAYTLHDMIALLLAAGLGQCTGVMVGTRELVRAQPHAATHALASSLSTDWYTP